MTPGPCRKIRRENGFTFDWPARRTPCSGHIQLLLVMFPGEEPLKIKLVDTGQWMTLPCVVHPALVRELRELLGEENVVLK